MNGVLSNSAQVLMAIGMILVIAEIFAPGFVLLPIGVTFLLTALLGIWIQSWFVLLPVLAVLEILVFFFFRDVLKTYHSKTAYYTNAEGMVGKECTVIDTISAHAAGYVKLYGDEWKAQTDCEIELTKGSRAIIARVDGNKVWVEPISGKEEKWN